LEAYLPLQSATIAYEVTKGISTPKQISKLEKHFVKRIVPVLEKNCINVCDPHIDTLISRYRKMTYTLPKEIRDFLENDDEILVPQKRKTQELVAN
jgi:hypothetical protein